jgi:hypothetical protein
MERLQQQRQERRERTGIVQIVLIAAVLLAALYGGLRLLSDTHAALQARKGERTAHVAEIREAANNGQRAKQLSFEEARKRRLIEYEQELSEGLQSGRLKCVQGVLFRRIPNGWENVPGDRCHSPSNSTNR